MAIHDILLPEQQSITSKNLFDWNDNAHKTTSEQNSFSKHQHASEKFSWLFWGSVGNSSEGTYFAYQMWIDYKGDDLIAQEYTLGNGLNFQHFHSLPDRPGNWIRIVDADTASLRIKLDPKKGTVSGTFAATFTNDGYNLNPEGNIRMSSELRDNT